MATASMEIAVNAGSHLVLTYDTITRVVSQSVLDNSQSGVIINWEALLNGVQIAAGTVQPGFQGVWAVPPATFTLGLIQSNPVIPLGIQLLTWT